MTEQNPITPPQELVERWIAEIWHEGTPVQVAASDLFIATRRPKPPSLEDQSLALIKKIQKGTEPWAISDLNAVVCALEQLPDTL